MSGKPQIPSTAGPDSLSSLGFSPYCTRVSSEAVLPTVIKNQLSPHPDASQMQEQNMNSWYLCTSWNLQNERKLKTGLGESININSSGFPAINRLIFYSSPGFQEAPFCSVQQIQTGSDGAVRSCCVAMSEFWIIADFGIVL